LGKNLFVTRSSVSLLDAFVPTFCISCKAVGSLFCERCRAEIKLNLHPVERNGFLGWSAHNLDSQLGNVILAFKERGKTALSSYLAKLALPALETFRERPISLVALPTSRAAFARRGFDASRVLAKALAKRSGLALNEGVLSLTRQPGDQRGLSLDQRVQNLNGSMAARKGSGRVLLVDDVVTTGASVLEGRRALVEAGFEVAGFITIAETLLQKTPKN
jgi:predicted amidophosphoribosyltransferase